ncbi:MAG TPA: thiamine-phosphate kinase [Rhodanobacteraceae bacterium]
MTRPSEFNLIEIIRARCASARADVRVGIGDDAAVLTPPPGHELVATTDTLVEHVHFPVATRPEDIGWKALAVNLSDLAAMGATPAWALLGLTLLSADEDFIARLADGFAALAAQHGVALIGGDTTRGPLAINVSAFGFVPSGRALLRSGARAGDHVFVTGTLGDAAAGLRFPFEGLFQTAASAEACDALRARLDRPTPRIAAGVVLRGIASACIDVSDGLIADLGHIARASRVGIEVAAAELPASPALLQAFDPPERTVLQATGGDDYELAFTLAPKNEAATLRDLAKAGCGATRIGRVVEGSGARLLDAKGTEIALPRQGWEHFS